MLVLACADLERLLRVADITAAMSVEALLGTDRAFAAELIALRPQPGQAGSAANLRALLRGLGDRREPPRRATRASRTPTRCAARRRSPAPRATRSRTAERVADAELRSAIDNPMVLPDGRVESCGNFHGAPGRVRLRLPRDRGAPRSARSPSGAPTGCSTPRRSHGLPPFLAERPGRQLGADDRPLHAGGDGRREPPAGRAGERRLAADERDAGGPRVDGLGRGAQAAYARSPTWGGSSPSSWCARRARSSCARRCSPAPGTGAALAGAADPASRAPGPDRFLSPELAAAEALIALAARCSTRSRRRSERSR